jgi:toxin CcdB
VSQYDVYPNPSTRSRDWVPYLVDVQSDLLSGLRTRLVMPLTRVAVDLPQAPRRLAPVFTIDGERLALQPQAAAGLDARLLNKPVASLAAHAGEIRDALDAVVSGI